MSHQCRATQRVTARTSRERGGLSISGQRMKQAEDDQSVVIMRRHGVVPKGHSTYMYVYMYTTSPTNHVSMYMYLPRAVHTGSTVHT